MTVHPIAADLIDALKWVRTYRSDLARGDTAGHAFADQEEAAIRANVEREADLRIAAIQAG
jgi:hypothetical protein